MKRHSHIPRSMLVALAVTIYTPAIAIADGEFASQKTVNSKGLKIKHASGLIMHITGLENTEKPGAECSLRVESMKKYPLGKAEWQQAGDNLKGTIYLELKTLGDTVFCDGYGAGCEVDVELPGAAKSTRGRELMGI